MWKENFRYPYTEWPKSSVALSRISFSFNYRYCIIIIVIIIIIIVIIIIIIIIKYLPTTY